MKRIVSNMMIRGSTIRNLTTLKKKSEKQEKEGPDSRLSQQESIDRCERVPNWKEIDYVSLIKKRRRTREKPHGHHGHSL